MGSALDTDQIRREHRSDWNITHQEGFSDRPASSSDKNVAFLKPILANCFGVD
jgi:hypothetical protein